MTFYLFGFLFGVLAVIVGWRMFQQGGRRRSWMCLGLGLVVRLIVLARSPCRPSPDPTKVTPAARQDAAVTSERIPR